MKFTINNEESTVFFGNLQVGDAFKVKDKYCVENKYKYYFKTQLQDGQYNAVYIGDDSIQESSELTVFEPVISRFTDTDEVILVNCEIIITPALPVKEV